jgi:transmembrane sensor
LRRWLGATPISTGIGEIRRLPLDDGSFAVVNSTSHIRVAFTPERRDIELARGEAWFEVAHNKTRPFTVSAGPVRVQAVGTAFDVRRRDGASEVVVTEGTVKVWSTSSGADPTLVTVGQRAMVREAGDVVVSELAPNLSDQRLAWREGRIVLDNMTLAEAADEFNRYHERTLEIDPALGNRHVVGWFHTDDLDGFTKAAAVMVGGHVVRDGDKVRIVP